MYSLFSIISAALISYASAWTFDEIISLMEYTEHELDLSSLLPFEKQQSTLPCFSPTLIQKRLLQPIHHCSFHLIRCLWYSMNRERDPVGGDPLMHPPVALTLIPFSVKLPWRLHIGSAWAIIKDNSSQVENKLEKKWIVGHRGCPTPDCYMAGMLM